MKYSMKDYLNGKCTHRQYYGQFVTPAIKQKVLERFGRIRLSSSKEAHFNDIPLHQWDDLAGCRISKGYQVVGIPTPRTLEDGSLATAVCILKEAAKQIIEEKEYELQK